MSFLRRERILYEGTSLYGPVAVVASPGRLELLTGQGHRQSSWRLSGELNGSVWDYYLVAPCFLPRNKTLRSLCLLGLGAGTAAGLFRRFFPKVKITGVESDPKIIELGKNYFGLQSLGLEVVCAEAAQFIAQTPVGFDLIIADTFQQDCFAKECETLEFYEGVKRRLNPGGVVVVNRAVTENQQSANAGFQALFLKLFPQTYTLAVHHNLFYLGLTQPVERERILGRIAAASRKNGLAFLKRFSGNRLCPLR